MELHDPELREAFAPNVVPRRRVVDRIASAADARITVIHAPAGYGKSTALRHYLDSRKEPSVFFGARPDDNTLIGFTRGLLESSAALSRAALPSLNAAYASAVRSGDPGRALAEWLAVFFKELPVNSLVALDDVQFGYDDPQTPRFVAALVDATKDAVNWVIAIRSAHPELPLSEWLAQGEMELPLDGVDLAFTMDDFRDLVGAAGSTEILEPTLNRWLSALDGWPTAILLALSFGVDELGDPPLGLTADELFALLADRFFAALTDRERAFLRVASKLRTVDPALCLMAGITDVHELSAGFLKAGVFVSYGNDRSVLRLHDLFFTRVEESSSDPYDEAWLSWANRICELLEERGRLSEALELSLKLNDVSRATAIVRNYGFSLWAGLHADLINRTIAFVNAAATPQKDPVILMLQATQIYRHGNVTEGTRLGIEALRLARDPLTRARIAAHHVIGAIVAQRLPPVDPALLEVEAGSDALAVAEIAGAQTMQLAVAGHYLKVRPVISATIRRLKQLPDSAFALVQYYLYACSASWLTGEWDEAAEYGETAVRDANDLGQLGLMTYGYSYLIMIALARGAEISTLYDYAKERERSELRSGHMQTMGLSRFFRLLVAVAAGDEQTVAETEREIRQTASPEFSRQFNAGRAKDLAIQHTWDGSFSEAHKLAAVAAPNLAVQEDIVRLSAVAMFAAAAGQREDAVATIAEIETKMVTLTFFGAGHILWRNFSRVYMALALIILRDETSASRCLALVEGYTGPLVGGLETVARGLVEHDVARSREGLQLIRRRGYLGYARMLEQIERCIARVRAGKPVAT